MKTTSPSPADTLGCVAYLLLMNGGRVDSTFLSDVGAALRTFDDEDLPDDGIVAPLPGEDPPPSAAAPIDEARMSAPATPPLALTHVFGTLIDFAL